MRTSVRLVNNDPWTDAIIVQDPRRGAAWKVLADELGRFVQRDQHGQLVIDIGRHDAIMLHNTTGGRYVDVPDNLRRCGCTNEQHATERYTCSCGASSTNCAARASRAVMADANHRDGCVAQMRRAVVLPPAPAPAVTPAIAPTAPAQHAPADECTGCKQPIAANVRPARVVLLPHGFTVGDALRDLAKFCAVKCLHEWCGRMLERERELERELEQHLAS